MASQIVESVIGAAVLAAAGGFLVYAANTTDLSTGGGGYVLTAEFQKAEGINPGGDVRIAGVKVGTIASMELDPTSYKAVVTLAMRDGVMVPEDSAAKITSASLLGDSFIAITPGASEYMLTGGDSFAYVQSSVNLMDLVGRFIQGSAEDE